MIFQLRIIIPVILLLTAIVLAVISLQYYSVRSAQLVESNEIRKFTHYMELLQQHLSAPFRTGEISKLQEKVAPLGSDPGIMRALVLDPDGNVLASLNIQHIGLALEQILKNDTFESWIELSSELDTVKHTLRGLIHPHAQDGHDLLVGIYPLEAGIKAGGLRSHRVGYLYIQHDISMPKMTAQRQIEHLAIEYGLVLVALAVLLYALSYFTVTRRLTKLISATEQLAAGDTSVRSNLSGRDELGIIGNAFDKMARQITEHQTRLKNSEERFRAAFHQAYTGMVLTDLKGNILMVNDAVCQLFGYDENELLVKTVLEITHPDDAGKSREIIGKLAAGEISSAQIEKRHICKDGHAQWSKVSIAVVRDANNNPQYTIAQVQDITRNKQAEEKIEMYRSHLEQLVELRTNELTAVNKELEAFSYSVSHDLRAPLRAIDGFSKATLEEYGDALEEQGKHYLQRVRKAAQHMGDLIDDILDLSRVGRSNMLIKPVDLTMIASEIMSGLREAEPQRKTELKIKPGLIVNGDSKLLHVMLDNLLQNAWKFTRNCDITRIEFSSTENDDEKIFYIRDNGAGFNESYKDKLFTPFQRLHPTSEFEGTGVGLATVHRIIQRHGGRIWAESGKNNGATFYFTLSE